MLYKAQVEYILGIKIYHGVMKIEPCVPEKWKKFEVKIKYYNAEYLIKYTRDNKDATILDGKNVEEIILEKQGSHIVDRHFK